MTNLERWRQYTAHLFSPNSYIDFGWLFCVTAALQRRVYFGRSLTDWPLFPNLYLILVGPPATGKSLVLEAAKRILQHHKQQLPLHKKEESVDYLIPLGPNKITIEAFIEKLAQSTKYVSIRESPNEKERPYAYASLSIILGELKSLFGRRNDDQLSTFTLDGYDCLDTYDYLTRTKGHFHVRNICLNIFAGCVPEFITDAQRYEIFNDGFVSRCLFIFEHAPRKDVFHLAEPTPEQISAKTALLDHILHLTKISGRLTYSQDTYAFLEDWWAKERQNRDSASPKMQTYYGRKRVHVLKLAAAFHFSESLSLEISQEAFAKAIKLLESIEGGMRQGFACGGRNTFSPITQDILRLIRNSPGGITKAELLGEFMSEVSLRDLDNILLELQVAQKVVYQHESYCAVR